MVFGWNRRGRPQERAIITEATAGAMPAVHGPASGSSLSGLAAIAGADDVSWAPLPASGSSSTSERKPKQLQPFKLRNHDVKARLQDRSTAVVDLRAEVADAPADVMFDLLADPHMHERIFDAIESASAELVSEEGPVRRWRLDYRARWRFWKVGGVCENRLWMTTDRERGTVSFVLREPGFLRKYEGTWTIHGPDGRGPGGLPRPQSTAITAAATFPSTPVSPSSSSSSAPASSAPPSPFTPRSLATTSSRSTSSSGSSAHSGDSGGSGVLFRARRSLDGGCSQDRAAAVAPAASLTLLRSASSGTIPGLFAAINNPFLAATAAAQEPTQQHQPQLATLQTSAATDAGPGAGDVVVSRPRTPTTILIRKAISPKVSPPFPVNQVLKGHAAGQVNDMLEGLLLATARRLAEGEGEREGAIN